MEQLKHKLEQLEKEARKYRAIVRGAEQRDRVLAGMLARQKLEPDYPADLPVN